MVVYYSLSGHTKEIADKIKELTNADIYEIQTAEKINTTPWFYLTLRNQIKKGEYPQLKEPLPALEQYDVVFVGGPVWWYTLATPLSSYLNKLIFCKKSRSVLNAGKQCRQLSGLCRSGQKCKNSNCGRVQQPAGKIQSSRR